MRQHFIAVVGAVPVQHEDVELGLANAHRPSQVVRERNEGVAVGGPVDHLPNEAAFLRDRTPNGH